MLTFKDISVVWMRAVNWKADLAFKCCLNYILFTLDFMIEWSAKTTLSILDHFHMLKYVSFVIYLFAVWFYCEVWLKYMSNSTSWLQPWFTLRNYTFHNIKDNTEKCQNIYWSTVEAKSNIDNSNIIKIIILHSCAWSQLFYLW